ncbi:Alpha/Beta hydrolase protein [Mycena pura]|uniref:Alpha/Beta hydrolase protein n=1 Tax=Mycena pura TaxID=153505 RepID=A0AAD7E4Y9_9AGAR|nr:Alpha/Beta hydrolase protein [Mycena pura]
MPKITLPSGHTWAYVDANPDGTTTMLCLHGFPDLAYGYRHQIGAWARAGFRVVVPDMLGYGGSDAPIDPAQYTTKRLTADLAALLTALNVDRAVVVGHDWGSFTANRFTLWHPDRVFALILMSIPYTPPALAPTLLSTVAARASNLGYQLYLASPEAAPALEKNLLYFLAFTFSPPDAQVNFTPAGVMHSLMASAPSASVTAALPCLLQDDVLRAYVAAFSARGLTGPTNYYRTTYLRGAEEAAASPPLPAHLPPELPVLSVYGALDATIAPAALKAQRRFVPRLTEMPIAHMGHWVLVQDARIDAEPPSFLSEGSLEDPLEGWREHTSAGAWREAPGDGGAVGRVVLEWLSGLGVGRGVRGKL